MAYLSYTNVGVTGIAAAVPKNIINNYEYTEHFTREEAADVIKKT